jgi:hypothetical protein
MDATTAVWTIAFPLLLALVAIAVATGFAMTSSDSPGFWVAKACFVTAAFDVVAFAIYWVISTRQELPWNIAIPTIGAIVAVPALVLSIQWLANLEIQLSTRLFPGDLPSPTIPPAGIPKDALKVFFGSNISWTTRASQTVLRMAGEKMIEISRAPGRKELTITTLKIFDDRNNIIARIDEDGFWVENSTRKKRPDSSTLVVYDHTDTEVLRLTFLNPTSISLTGIFRHAGVDPVIVTSEYMQLPGNNRMAQMAFSGGANIISVGN